MMETLSSLTKEFAQDKKVDLIELNLIDTFLKRKTAFHFLKRFTQMLKDLCQL